MKKLLILLLPLLGFAIGAAGGAMMPGASAGAKPQHQTARAGPDDAPDAPPAEAAAGHGAEAGAEASHAGTAKASDHGATGSAAGLDWFKFPNQFFVPVLRNGSTTAVMILSLSLEIRASGRTDIETQEHRLRDALLGALMIEANTGAFDGNFTSDPAMQRLRSALLAAARNAAGPKIERVLIEDIGRQVQ